MLSCKLKYTVYKQGLIQKIRNNWISGILRLCIFEASHPVYNWNLMNKIPYTASLVWLGDESNICSTVIWEVLQLPITVVKIPQITVIRGSGKCVWDNILFSNASLGPPCDCSTGATSECNISIPECFSRPGGLKSMRELSQRPLVVDHVELTHVCPKVWVVLAAQRWIWTL